MSAAEVAGVVLAAGLGASVGSFLAVAAERLPKGESLGGRSHCGCGALILARDNLPVVGFALRRGRARCCGARIPGWYLAAEVGGALAALAVYVFLIA